MNAHKKLGLGIGFMGCSWNLCLSLESDRLYQWETLLNRTNWRLKWNTFHVSFSYLEQKKTAAPRRDHLVQQMFGDSSNSTVLLDPWRALLEEASIALQRGRWRPWGEEVTCSRLIRRLGLCSSVTNILLSPLQEQLPHSCVSSRHII